MLATISGQLMRASVWRILSMVVVPPWVVDIPPPTGRLLLPLLRIPEHDCLPELGSGIPIHQIVGEIGLTLTGGLPCPSRVNYLRGRLELSLGLRLVLRLDTPRTPRRPPKPSRRGSLRGSPSSPLSGDPEGQPSCCVLGLVRVELRAIASPPGGSDNAQRDCRLAGVSAPGRLEGPGGGRRGSSAGSDITRHRSRADANDQARGKRQGTRRVRRPIRVRVQPRPPQDPVPGHPAPAARRWAAAG